MPCKPRQGCSNSPGIRTCKLLEMLHKAPCSLGLLTPRFQGPACSPTCCIFPAPRSSPRCACDMEARGLPSGSPSVWHKECKTLHCPPTTLRQGFVLRSHHAQGLSKSQDLAPYQTSNHHQRRNHHQRQSHLQGQDLALACVKASYVTDFSHTTRV